MAKNTPGKAGDSLRAARLRQQAEEFLRTAPRDIEVMSAEAIQVLVHELQVYQVELEMQNEELRQVQHDLEESRDQYQDLFDFAPVGYLSMDHEGRIEQANLTAARLLGVDRAQLQGAPLARFVVSEDRDVLHQHRQAVKDSGSHGCELRLQPSEGKQRDVRLETQAVRDETRDTPVYRMVLLIITERKQAEERFRQLLESAPDAMIVLDSQDGIALVNAQMEQVFGYTRQELLGQPVEMLLPQRFRRKHVTHRVRYFANPTSRPMGAGLELCGLRKDGTEFPIEVSLSPLETEAGLLVSAAIRDISARKQMEEALQKAHEELEFQVDELKEANASLQAGIFERQQAEAALQIAYQKLDSHVENSPLAVIEWDSEFRMQRWSAMAEKMFGWTVADVHGKRPEDWRFVYEEDEKFLRDRKNSLVRGEESPRQTIFHNRNYTKDGRLLECEWYNSELSDEAGKLTSILSLVQDVTERKQAEQALRQERDFAENLIEMAQAIVLVLDTTGRIVRFNPYMEELSGYRLEEVQGKDWFTTFLPKRCQDSTRHMFKQATQDMQTRGYINPIVTKGGHERTIEWYDKTLKDNMDKVTGLLCTGIDITERMRIEEELRTLNTELEQRVNARTADLQTSEQRLRELAHEQEQLLIASDRLVSLGELAASLAHEFNNPLGIAMGFVQDLLSEAQPTDPSYRRLQIIESQTRRCSQLIKDLTNLARPLQAHRIPTDLAAVVRRSLDLVSGRLRQNKIETQLDLATQLDPVAVDPQQLEQVLLNIYFNAIEAMPAGGTLTVRVWKHPAAEEAAGEGGYEEQSEVRIAVTDTGIGITPDHRAQIFRPFFTTKKQRGMGLGLSICDSIMRAHSGRISIDSTPGQGTTVLLHSPMDVPTVENSIVENSHDNNT